ncbi:MAG: hypothetical protein JXO72_16135 [Vicinamibacteria bacterium]|nr:hypothetical protein [Vicinamibacteria bacterium]
MPRVSILIVVGALGAVLAGSAWARKVAPIAARCPEGTKRQIDWEETRDMCLRSSPPSCPDGTSLREDSADDSDQCVADQTTATTPSCPEDLTLHVRSGADICAGLASRANCRKGFRLRVLPGEDMCVR